MAINSLKKSVEMEIEFCENEIRNRSVEIKEYLDLRNRLDLFPRKLSHDILVPMSKVGYMPGRIVQTNKVMVLLGDNYFVVRSCFQACEIVDRRVEVIKKIISSLESQKKLAQSRLEFGEEFFTKKNNDEIEIHEPYDEKLEEKWRVERTEKKRKKEQNKIDEEAESCSQNIFHQKNEENSMDLPQSEKLENQTECNVGEISRTRKEISGQEFAKLLERLDELERQEELEDEFNSESDSGRDESIDSDDYPYPEADNLRSSNGLCPGIKMSKELSKIEETIQANKKSKSVHFNPEIAYSPNCIPSKQNNIEGSLQKTVEHKRNIVDEESRFSVSLPRSILRHSSDCSPVDRDAILASETDGRRYVTPGSNEAFTGVIQEHLSPEDQVANTEICQKLSTTNLSDNQPKRISRFKMARAVLDN